MPLTADTQVQRCCFLFLLNSGTEVILKSNSQRGFAKDTDQIDVSLIIHKKYTVQEVRATDLNTEIFIKMMTVVISSEPLKDQRKKD